MIMGINSHMIQVLMVLLVMGVHADLPPTCPSESARNIPNGAVGVVTNGGWTLGGWGFASLFNAANFGGNQYNWGSGNFGYGNFGDDNQGSQNYGNSNLGDNNLGSFNVGNDNCGSYNVGSGNVGTWNVGNLNNGSYNVGSGNVGVGNTGAGNVGDLNVGTLNAGDGNLGISNSGDSNLGISNVGDGNVGWENEGDSNIGSLNVGDGNVGIDNVGTYNIGYLNNGNNNTGAFNYGEGNVGFIAGVQAATFSVPPSEAPDGRIPWDSIALGYILEGSDGTGWGNLNDSNVGISQSGYRNLGYLTGGTMNIGYSINGTANTGGRLDGDDLIGFDQTSSQADPFTGPFSDIQPASEMPLLLSSTLSGFMDSLAVSVYPSVWDAASSEVNTNTLTGCSTFTPVPYSSVFSVSVRCRGSFKITDLYCSGDSFQVYKDGKLWFVTPVVPIDSDVFCIRSVSDPEEAFYDPAFSHYQAWLPSGSYKITVVPMTTRWGGGGVAVKVDDFCDRSTLGKPIRF
jgi:hypothetical protein